MEKYRKITREKEPIGSDEIRIMAAGNLIKYIEYAKGLLEEKEKKQLTIKATGNAISKAVALAEIIKRTFKGLHQLTVCGSTTIKDHYEPTEEGLDPVTEERVVSFLEITLSYEPSDKNHPGYQPPLDDAIVDEFDLEKANVVIGRGGYRNGRGFRGGRGYRGGRGFRGGRGGYAGVETNRAETNRGETNRVESDRVENDVGEGSNFHKEMDSDESRGRGRGMGNRSRGRGFRGRRGGYRGGRNE